MSSSIEFEANSSVIEGTENRLRNNGKVQKQEKKIIAPSKQKVLTLVSALASHAEKKPNKTAVTFLKDGNNEEENITYQELYNRARIIASYLQSQNIQSGDRALLIYPPGLEYISAFFGCLVAGVIAVPAYPPRQNHNLNRLASILKDVTARVVLTNEKLKNQIKTNPNFQELFLSTKNQNLQFVVTDKLTQGNQLLELPDITEESVAFIQYTSGSTSEPKGVVLTHKNLIHNMNMIKSWAEMDLIENYKIVSWLPPYHDMGLIGNILLSILNGYQIIQMSPVSFIKKPVRWLEAISKYRANYSGGPNFAFDLCTENILQRDCEGLDLSSWRVAFNGAEVIRTETMEKFTKKFKNFGFQKETFHPCYGLAEATLFVTGKSKAKDQTSFQSVKKGKVNFASSGGQIDGCEIKIVDPNSFEECKEKQIGEIWVKGGNVAKGYYNKEKETKETFFATIANATKEPFLRTGDLAFLEDGEIYITGRIKELILHHGMNLYPQDLENVAENSHPALVKNGSVVFSVQKKGEERLVAIAELTRDHKRYLPKEIFNAIRNNILKEFEVDVNHVILTKRGETPKTTSGKKQRLLAKTRYNGNEILKIHEWKRKEGLKKYQFIKPEITDSQEKSDVEDTIKRIISNRIHVSHKLIESDKPLVEFGLDSLGLISLAGELEQVLNLQIPTELFQDNVTVQNILKFVEEVDNRNSISIRGGLNGFGKDFRGLGENFDVNEIFENNDTNNAHSFLERIQFTTQQFNESLGELKDLYKREICSPIDREVLVRDPFTGKKKQMLMFGSNNYLGLANHPYIIKRVKKDMDQFGFGVNSAPHLSGYTQLHKKLEEKLSSIKNCETTMLFTSGYQANVGLFSSILSMNSILICDEFSHASIIDGVRMGQAKVFTFKHNDWEHLSKILETNFKNSKELFVSVEGLYSMDGDLPPIDEIQKLCETYKATLIIDDAHATGVLGKNGFGTKTSSDYKCNKIIMGTLSKALGSIGGFVSSSKEIIEFLRTTSRSYIFSTSLPIACISASLSALELLEKKPKIRSKLQKNIEYLKKSLQKNNIPFKNFQGSPIITIDFIKNKESNEGFLKIHEKNIFVNSVQFPVVPKNILRMRISVMASHGKNDLDKLVTNIQKNLKNDIIF